MKRKILSLALVLMLVVSMIPMGAFAASISNVDAYASMYSSKVSVDKSAVTADDSSTAEFKVYAYTTTNAAAKTDIIVVSNRGTTDHFTTDGAYNLSTDAKGAYVITSDFTTGKASIKVKSAVVGTAKFGFFLATASGTVDTTNYVKLLNGVTDATNGIDATSLKLIGTQDINFTADSVNGVTLIDTKKYTAKDVPTGSGGTDNPKGNGVNFYELTYKVATSTGTPVSGETLTVSADNTAVSFDTTSKVTDGSGTAVIKVYATKSGTFKITAKAAGKTSDNNVTFGASDVTGLQLITSNNVTKAKDELTNVKVMLVDSNGNQIKMTTDSVAKALYNAGNVNVEVKKEPSTSNLAITASSIVAKDDYFRVNLTPTKEGDYTIKIWLTNGKSVDWNFKVQKQGDVKSINFYYDEAIVPLGKIANSFTLERVDANGVTKDMGQSTSNFAFSSSDTSLATVASNGDVTITTDKDDIGKSVVITALDKDNKITKSYTMKIGGKLASVKAEVPATLAAGIAAPVKVQFVDNKGNVVAFSTPGTINIDSYVIEKPEGAIVGTEASSTFSADMKIGGGVYNISSNKEGKVKIQLVITTPDNDSYSTILELNFGKSTATATDGKGIILTIGNTVGIANGAPQTLDLAPFIQDGRAFVPVRFISEALGAKVEFTKTAAGLTDTVTLTQGSTVVTMKINDKNIKVVKDGKETAVTSDVAAMIKNGRTVLPFRALADALGATATYGMKADNSGVEWVKFVQ